MYTSNVHNWYQNIFFPFIYPNSAVAPPIGEELELKLAKLLKDRLEFSVLVIDSTMLCFRRLVVALWAFQVYLQMGSGGY